MKTLEYNGYKGSIKWNEYIKRYYGSILDVEDTFPYGGGSLEELEKDFQLIVDNYIEFRKKHPNIEMFYKGFKGYVHWYEPRQPCYYGEVLDVDGCFLYEGDNVEELEKDFQLAVEDYIIFREKHFENIKMSYKGYTGSIEWSRPDQCYFGKILDVRGLFSYEGNDLEELKKDFYEVVDEYIE